MQAVAQEVQPFRIDQQRLWDSLMDMAKIGATAKGGSCRLAFSEEDTQGRRLLMQWCEALGCEMRVDEVGNLFIRREGSEPSLAPVSTGSHLDTQPKGGRFDGILGVLAGLEVFRVLDAQGIVTRRPLELIVWGNEEGSRFSPAMVASGTYAGVFEPTYTLAREDSEGITYGEALASTGLRTPDFKTGPRLDSYFELHIEQGPVLEQEGKSLGVVTGVQGIRWFDVTISGVAAHAGPTPMRYRRDAMMAAARLMDQIHQHVQSDPTGNARVTVGTLNIPSASRNVIPGEVSMTVDLRHVKEAELETLEATFMSMLEKVSEEYGVSVTQERIWKSEVVDFDEACIEVVRQAVANQDAPSREMMSGAGHDAVYVSRVAPTAMIFVPCLDGISHNEAEYASPEDCALGCQVLLESVLARAGR